MIQAVSKHGDSKNILPLLGVGDGEGTGITSWLTSFRLPIIIIIAIIYWTFMICQASFLIELTSSRAFSGCADKVLTIGKLKSLTFSICHFLQHSYEFPAKTQSWKERLRSRASHRVSTVQVSSSEGPGGRSNKEAQGNRLELWVSSLARLWWWFCACIRMSKLSTWHTRKPCILLSVIPSKEEEEEEERKGKERWL